MWMWFWIAVFVTVVIALAKLLDRRGSKGAARALDLPGTKEGRPRPIDTGDGFNGM